MEHFVYLRIFKYLGNYFLLLRSLYAFKSTVNPWHKLYGTNIIWYYIRNDTLKSITLSCYFSAWEHKNLKTYTEWCYEQVVLHQGLTAYNNHSLNNDELLETLISLVKIAIQLLFKRIYCLTKNWKNIHNKVHNQYHNTLNKGENNICAF